MKNTRKKLINVVMAMFLVALSITFLPMKAYASTGIPTNVWNLHSKGQYNFSGSAGGSTLYTNYKFTGASKVKIQVKNKHSTTSLSVKIHEVGTGWFGTDKIVDTVKLPANGTVTWTTSFNNKEKYYISFSAPSNFSGYIKEA